MGQRPPAGVVSCASTLASANVAPTIHSLPPSTSGTSGGGVLITMPPQGPHAEARVRRRLLPTQPKRRARWKSRTKPKG